MPMCDIDGGFDVDFFADSHIDDSSEDGFDVVDDSRLSDLESMPDVDDVAFESEAVESMQDTEEPFESFDTEETGDYLALSEFEDLGDATDDIEGLEDTSDQSQDVELQEEMWDSDDAPSLSELDEVEPEFGDKMRELTSSGRLIISEMEDIDESGEEGVKVLTRDITPENLESRERDTEEVLENYRENLQERGVSEEQIEEFIEQERESISAEYESLDAGKPAENIYQTPMDWDAVVDSIENSNDIVSTADRADDESFQLDSEEIYEETMDSDDIQEEYNQNDEGDKTLGAYPAFVDTSEDSEEENLGDLRQQLTGVYGITEDNPEIESIMQNEQSGWKEPNGDNSLDNMPEGSLVDDNAELCDITPLSNMDDITSEETRIIEDRDILTEVDETAPTIDDIPVEGDIEEISGERVAEEIGESSLSMDEDYDESDIISERLDDSLLVEEGINEIIDDAEQIDDISGNTRDIPNENIDETQEVGIDYDEIYEGISQEGIEQGFEDVDIYEDSERLDASLENFEANNWETLTIDDQKQSINDLAEYVEEVIGFNNPPRIEYYNNPREGDYGGYDSKTNTLRINEYMLYNNSEAADTVAHELWHAHQHECAECPSSARDYQYQYNFENYIRPEMGHEAYENQLIEAEARAFAAQFKGRLAEIGSRRMR